MNKEQLLKAMRRSEDEHKPMDEWFWDEWVTIYALVANAADSEVEKAWAEVNPSDFEETLGGDATETSETEVAVNG